MTNGYKANIRTYANDSITVITLSQIQYTEYNKGIVDIKLRPRRAIPSPLAGERREGETACGRQNHAD